MVRKSAFLIIIAAVELVVGFAIILEVAVFSILRPHCCRVVPEVAVFSAIRHW